jgi:hypothetical protein
MTARVLSAASTLAVGLALSVSGEALAQAAAPAPEAKVVAAPAPEAKVAAPAGAASGDIGGLPPPDARWRALVGGLGMFAVSYGSMALMGALWTDLPGADYLFIPVAGPWIGLGESGCAPGEETTIGEGDCGGMMGLRGTIYVVDALLQLGGLGLIAESIFLQTDNTASASISPVPFVVRDAVGLGVAGTF